MAEALLENVIATHGVSKDLHSDQRRNFQSKVWKELMNLLSITKKRVTPVHPQFDGIND